MEFLVDLYRDNLKWERSQVCFWDIIFTYKMRKIVVIIALAISLMSTKCAEEPVNIVFDNESYRNVVFSFVFTLCFKFIIGVTRRGIYGL